MTAVDILQELGITFALPGSHHHVRAGWIGLDCPNCSPHSGSFKAGLTERLGAASCWRCGRLDVVDTLAKVARVDHRDVLKLLAPFWGTARHASDRKTSVRFGKLSWPFKLHDINPLSTPYAVEYLKTRNFPMGARDVIELWQLQGVANVTGPWAFRIFAPIHKDGAVVSWTTRATGNCGQRWVSASPEQESFPAKQLLYGADFIPGRTAIVVEGPSDAWAVGPGAIATLGLKFTPQQLRLMGDFARVFVCFDNEPAAQRRAADLAADLAAVVPSVERLELDADDPGAISQKEWVDLRTYCFGGI